MNISAPFIRRPVATSLLTLGVALAGAVAFFLLPVAPLPQVDSPAISVSANMAGASPETMAASVATPLERRLGTIADVTEMTSSSSIGSTRIQLVFGLNRNIDGAARDVQAAINAARADLPTALRSNPTYRKANTASAPVVILTLTSDTLSTGQIYDAASTVLGQKLSQIEGVGDVTIGGSSLPAVRAELNPHALFKYGIGLEDVRAALSAANAHSPKGAIEDETRHWQLYTNDQARTADQYRTLLVAYRNGAPVRLADVAEVVDSVEDLHNLGLANGKPSVVVIITCQPGANIIATADRITALIPQLQAAIPASVRIGVGMERTTTIRASLHEVEKTLLTSTMLVIMVVFLFLRNARATLIPAVAVPVSLIGTFGVMYLCGFSLDNLSLMALTIATGFVVDDAIVVLENISRHLEAGMKPVPAALLGAREVGFTVLAMSISLIAVFIPILLMGGLVGRLFHEFAITLSVAILVSLAVSLTTTPMMCARLLRSVKHQRAPSRFAQASERFFARLLGAYERSLTWALRHSPLMMIILLITVCLNVYLYIIIPKGFFPQQDTGRLMGGIQADQSISFTLMQQKLHQFLDIVQKDPDVQNVIGFTGGGQTNSARAFVTLKAIGKRTKTVDEVIARLRVSLSVVPGASLFLQAVQDIRAGGRQSNSQYQYTLQGDDIEELRTWSAKIVTALQSVPQLADVNSDQQDRGLETRLTIDRATATRLGLSASQIDNTLYDAFGQRQVSVIYNPLNQYHVVMEVGPQYWKNPDALKELYVSTSGGVASGSQATNALSRNSAPASKSGKSTASTSASNPLLNASNVSTGNSKGASTGNPISSVKETMVPLSAFSSFGPSNTALAVNHQGPFVATTISYNLPLGVSLSDAVQAIQTTMAQIHVPATIHGSFEGTAKVFQSSLDSQPFLILAALVAVYIVLGMLYESYVHPLTILSTLPSAGVGALLALLACDEEFSLIALIGVILLIGIVKKNAIMMIDFALDAERNQGLIAHDAIFQACLLRFRPIMMTTMAALLGALPLALGAANGAELRRPLGIAIVGGLVVSQMLTLYTTPVVYIYLDRFRVWAAAKWQRSRFGNNNGKLSHGNVH
jgi:multidrug efflux pump